MAESEADKRIHRKRHSTRDIMIAFIRYRLRDMEVNGSFVEELRPLYTDFCYDTIPAVRAMLQYARSLDEDIWCLEGFAEIGRTFDFTANDCKENYNCIVNSVFNGQTVVTWDLISQAFVYTFELMMWSVMRSDDPGLVMTIIDWCLEYFNRDFITDWLETNNGWEAIPVEPEEETESEMEILAVHAGEALAIRQKEAEKMMKLTEGIEKLARGDYQVSSGHAKIVQGSSEIDEAPTSNNSLYH